MKTAWVVFTIVCIFGAVIAWGLYFLITAFNKLEVWVSHNPGLAVLAAAGVLILLVAAIRHKIKNG